MQTLMVMVFILVGMTFMAGLSVALHGALPSSLRDGAARHGRFSGLGTRSPPCGTTAGNAPVADRECPLGQPV
jgi:hypothetical protein